MKRAMTTMVALALAASSLALTACEDDDGDVSADEQEIIDAITTSATTTDPSACTELQTQAFVEQTTGETGNAAVKSCEGDQGDESVAESVEVTETEIEDGTATAVAAFTGGFIDGQSLEIGLVDEGGQWKLDELIGFQEFDREAFINTVTEGLEEELPDNPEIGTCVRQQLEGAPEEDLQATFLENDDTLFEQTLAPCFEGQQGA